MDCLCQRLIHKLEHTSHQLASINQGKATFFNFWCAVVASLLYSLCMLFYCRNIREMENDEPTSTYDIYAITSCMMIQLLLLCRLLDVLCAMLCWWIRQVLVLDKLRIMVGDTQIISYVVNVMHRHRELMLTTISVRQAQIVQPVDIQNIFINHNNKNKVSCDISY